MSPEQESGVDVGCRGAERGENGADIVEIWSFFSWFRPLAEKVRRHHHGWDHRHFGTGCTKRDFRKFLLALRVPQSLPKAVDGLQIVFRRHRGPLQRSSVCGSIKMAEQNFSDLKNFGDFGLRCPTWHLAQHEILKNIFCALVRQEVVQGV